MPRVLPRLPLSFLLSLSASLLLGLYESGLNLSHALSLFRFEASGELEATDIKEAVLQFLLTLSLLQWKANHLQQTYTRSFVSGDSDIDLALM